MDPRIEAFKSPEFDRVFGAVASLPGAADEETLDVPAIDPVARSAVAAVAHHARTGNPDPASRLLLIKGPAGTGKTHTLVTAIRQLHAAGDIYGVVLPMVDPVSESEFDGWLTRAIVTRLSEPHLVQAGAPLPLHRLAEKLLAVGPEALATAFRAQVMDGSGDMAPEDFKRLVNGIRQGLAGPQRVAPVGEAFVAALLGSYAGYDEGLDYLRGLPVEGDVWGVKLAHRAHDQGARALIEQLAAAASATAGALLIAFDQMEQNRFERWEDRLRHIVGRGALFAETLPGLCVIFAVLPALYDSVAQEIDRSIRDRIEKFGALPVSMRNLSRPQVAMLLKHRLAALYARNGAAVDEVDPLFPFEDWFVDELSGQTSRYVTEMVQTFRRLLLELGHVPAMDDFPPPTTEAAPVAFAPVFAAIDFGESWERYMVQTMPQPTPVQSFVQAEYLEWAILASLPELEGVKALRTRKTSRANTMIIELEIEAANGDVERREIALCNETHEGATLANEIRGFVSTCRKSRAVIVRPRGRPLPRSGRGAGAVLRDAEDNGAIIIRQFDKPSWERLQIAKSYFVQKDYPGFMDWQRNAKPLTQIAPLAAILQYPYVKPEAKSDEADEQALAAQAKIIQLRQPDGASVMLGEAATGQVHWAPSESTNKLLNFGLLVTGDPGSGKTQTLNVLIDGVVEMGFPVCIFDFKKDYVSPDFVAEQRLRVHDVRRDGLPFNPLLPSADRDGRAKPVEHIFTICGVLKRVFRLGDQQEAKLRDAMKQAFERRGVDTQAWANADEISAPCFDEVIIVLREYEEQKDNTARNLLNRLSPLFELGLFPKHDAKGGSFDAMLGERVVLALFDLPSKEIQSALAELIIIRLHGYLVRGEHPRRLTRLLVLDEAWRVAGSTHLESLAREGRAFGVALAIGTQYPGDLPADLAGALATKIFLKNQQPDHKKATVRALCGATSGPEAQRLYTMIDNFAMFEGVIQNQHYTPYQTFKLTPYYVRKEQVAEEPAPERKKRFAFL
ncbi:MAG: DUF87 domain-containing protein [Hyphomicrobiales bacterium]|nr:DUF87 domain-containing protein [Hyphomicrobiales bacterium]